MSEFYFYPIKNKFDIKKMESFIDSLAGVVMEEINGTVHCSLIGNEKEASEIKELKKKYPNEIVYLKLAPKITGEKSPLFIYDPNGKLFGISLQYIDNNNNDAKKIIEFILNNFECEGQDWEGHKYNNSNECRYWLKMWLDY